MQTAGGIDEHDISAVGFCALQCVESDAGRVGSHLLLDDGHAHAVAPDLYLLYGSSPKGVGGTEIYFLSGLFELISQFAYGCGFADTVDTHYQYHIRLVVAGQVPVAAVFRVVFGEQ